MAFAKCDVCGRPRKGFVDLDVQWDLEYGVFLCKDCRQQVQETRKALIDDIAREIPDCHRVDKEEETMKVKVRRDEKKEIEVDIDDLQYGDEFDISKNGEVIAVGTVADVWTNKGVRRANVDLTFTKESKTWQDLGYDCFEDMIDDITKEHGSTGHKYAGEWVNEIYLGTFDGHLIADSYRDCIISIYDAKTDKHAIINAPCATVYIPDKAKYFNDSFEDMIDDIARGHKEERIVKPRYKCCDCLDAADSYGESYVEIEQNGAKTIAHSDSVTVYPVRKEDD